MKNYLKGLVCGLIIAVAVMCIPAVAENISVAFNEFRINVNGVDAAQWGESYTLDNGAEVPYSMTYNDTTYLPLRKIGELIGKHIAYNGDTGTVSVIDEQNSNVISSVPYQGLLLAEKPDANGNVWKYYTFEIDNTIYLGAIDEVRGFERIYKTMSRNQKTAVTVTDDAIYFAKYIGNYDNHPFDVNGAIQKISFANTPDTQDGEEVSKLKISPKSALFDGEYMYSTSMLMTLTSTAYLHANNIYTGETAVCTMDKGTSILEIIPNGEGRIRCIVQAMSSAVSTYEVTLDKTPFAFGKPTIIETK